MWIFNHVIKKIWKAPESFLVFLWNPRRVIISNFGSVLRMNRAVFLVLVYFLHQRFIQPRTFITRKTWELLPHNKWFPLDVANNSGNRCSNLCPCYPPLVLYLHCLQPNWISWGKRGGGGLQKYSTSQQQICMSWFSQPQIFNPTTTNKDVLV